MGGRDIHSPLGIPKSPSFHSGLDLVASVGVEESVKKAFDQHETTGFPGKISFYSGNSANFGTSVTFGGSGVNTPTLGGIPGPGATFAGYIGNDLAMINGKPYLDGVNGGMVVGAMKNGIGLSMQALALQKNSTAVRSMQAMGHLPLLKGTIDVFILSRTFQCRTNKLKFRLLILYSS